MLSVLVVCCPCGAAGLALAQNKQDSGVAAQPATSGAPAATATDTLGADRDYGPGITFLGSVPSAAGDYVYLMVPPEMTDQQIINLAQRLHDKEPDHAFWLFDDESKARQLLDSLPTMAEGDYSTYPEEWVEEHVVASIQLAIVPHEGKYWVVLKGASMDAEAPLAKLK